MWMYQQDSEQQIEEPIGLNSSDPPVDNLGVTLEVRAIQQHDECHHEVEQEEQAMLKLHAQCVAELSKLGQEESELLDSAQQAQQAGELDVLEYTTKLHSLLQMRKKVQQRLHDKLASLDVKLRQEEAAATKLETLL